MLIFSRKKKKKKLWNTPFTTPASKSRQKRPYFKSGSPRRVCEAAAQQRPCRWAWRAVLGCFPAGCSVITRIRKSCITFCRENTNGKLQNNAIGSRLFPFKNKRPILVRVGAEFQKDTMDIERKKEKKKRLSSKKLLTAAAAWWPATKANPETRDWRTWKGSASSLANRPSSEIWSEKEHQSWDLTLTC